MQSGNGGTKADSDAVVEAGRKTESTSSPGDDHATDLHGVASRTVRERAQGDLITRWVIRKLHLAGQVRAAQPL
jgi:hypothetical protein